MLVVRTLHKHRWGCTPAWAPGGTPPWALDDTPGGVHSGTFDGVAWYTVGEELVGKPEIFLFL